MTTLLASLVDRYAQRIYPAICAQHEGQSVSSPLGMWLLLAAVVPSARDQQREVLEEVLGCEAGQAKMLLHEFLTDIPPALSVAVALWLGQDEDGEGLTAWVDDIFKAIEVGPLPDQAGANAWANEHTQGLITKFPVDIELVTRLILASAIACRVSWVTPFTTTNTNGFPASSPWRNSLTSALLTRTGAMLLCDTQEAGLIAAHSMPAREGLDVISVIAHPDIEADRVMAATHEIARLLGGQASTATQRSLFDVAVGEGHAWAIIEDEVATHIAGEQVEQYRTTTLAAWHANSRLNLLEDDVFGAQAAGETLVELLGKSPLGDEVEAMQVATASYTKEGFEAAAVTAIVDMLGMAYVERPSERGLKRSIDMRFDHPYAAVAFTTQGQATGDGLALFSAWVAEPDEA